MPSPPQKEGAPHVIGETIGDRIEWNKKAIDR
jgi:hypothetical protein